MATNSKIKLGEGIKLVSKTREEKRKAQRDELIKQGLKQRKAAGKGKY